MTSDIDFDAIFELELSLHRPAVRQASASVTEILADDFLEFGRSGRIYDKQATLIGLAAERNEPVSDLTTVTNIAFKTVSDDVVLLTYFTIRRTVDGNLRTLRSSLWRRNEGRWQMVFHQGTPVPVKS